MKKIEVFIVNAFTRNPLGGNPAGVVTFGARLTPQEMLAAARQAACSETAFIMPSEKADYMLRFFTPVREVPLCGHATIASFSLLRDRGAIEPGKYFQETGAGILEIEITETEVFMQQAMPSFGAELSKEEAASSLGIKQELLHPSLPAQLVSTGLNDIIIPLNSKQALDSFKPDFNAITQASRKHFAVGCHVFAPGESKYAAFCRNFAPLYGINEEAATGTANGALACYLQSRGAANSEQLLFLQGEAMHKPSEIKARLSLADGHIRGIYVGGGAVETGRIEAQV